MPAPPPPRARAPPPAAAAAAAIRRGAGRDARDVAGPVLLALDHFDRVLVWSGADVAGADHDALRAAVRRAPRGLARRAPALPRGADRAAARRLEHVALPRVARAEPQGPARAPAGALRRSPSSPATSSRACARASTRPTSHGHDGGRRVIR